VPYKNETVPQTHVSTNSSRREQPPDYASTHWVDCPSSLNSTASTCVVHQQFLLEVSRAFYIASRALARNNSYMTAHRWRALTSARLMLQRYHVQYKYDDGKSGVYARREFETSVRITGNETNLTAAQSDECVYKLAIRSGWAHVDAGLSGYFREANVRFQVCCSSYDEPTNSNSTLSKNDSTHDAPPLSSHYCQHTW
jgi:hypothetical protein